MDHARLVRMVQGLRDLDTQLGSLARCESFGLHPLLEGRALNEVADDVDRAVLLADFVDADDVGMFQLSRRARVAQEQLGL